MTTHPKPKDPVVSVPDALIDAYLDEQGATLFGRAFDVSTERGREPARAFIRSIIEAFEPPWNDHLDVARKALTVITEVAPFSGTSRLDVSDWSRALDRCRTIAAEALDIMDGGPQ